MRWVNLSVKPNFSWPNTEVEIPFEGHRIMLLPLTENTASSVSVYSEDGSLSFDDGGTIISRFLSRLSWSRRGGIEEVFLSGSEYPDFPGRLGRLRFSEPVWMSTDPWMYLYLPQANSYEADLALALFREGASVNSKPFSFLSYFKIFNISYSSGSDQKKWINDNYHKLKEERSLKRISEISETIDNLGAYLYHQGRCAIAHANG